MFQVKLSIIEQDNSTWLRSNCSLKEHTGHVVSAAEYLKHRKIRNITAEDEALIKQLDEASAKPANIAAMLNSKGGHGQTYDAQFIRNIKAKLDKTDGNAKTVEEALAEIVDKGGEVLYTKKDRTNNVETMLVQTEEQKKHLLKCKPTLFQSDTTFGTQSEKFKMYVLVYLSQYTGMWEVSATIFLASETGQNVRKALQAFKNIVSKYDNNRL